MRSRVALEPIDKMPLVRESTSLPICPCLQSVGLRGLSILDVTVDPERRLDLESQIVVRY